LHCFPIIMGRAHGCIRGASRLKGRILTDHPGDNRWVGCSHRWLLGRLCLSLFEMLHPGWRPIGQLPWLPCPQVIVGVVSPPLEELAPVSGIHI
jgi:hypothetical protein